MAEGGFRRSDDGVACHGQIETAPRATPVDRGDHRRRVVGEAIRDRASEFGIGEATPMVEGGDFPEVRAGEEDRRVSRCQDQGAW